MAVNVTMPKWGMTMKEGKISKWFKAEGDTIEKGEPFFEVETEKITNVVEATASGIVFQIVVSAGTKVPVGTILAVIAEPGEQPERIVSFDALACCLVESVVGPDSLDGHAHDRLGRKGEVAPEEDLARPDELLEGAQGVRVR